MKSTILSCAWMRIPTAFIVITSSAICMASEMGQAAADEVSEASYRYFLGDNQGTPGILFTHAGDNRGYGAEHDPARANIVSELQSYGLSVTLEPFLQGGGTFYNVVATKTGTTYPDQEFIIGAHFDSVDNPGADDNASGVALVLEAARILSQYRSAYTIRFVAFDREEQGLYGSEAYVDAHAGDTILGMISADMVAYDPGTNHALIYGRSASAPIKTALAQAVSLYSDGLTYTVGGDTPYSDHAPFEAAGLQACLLIEGEVWNNPYYHTQQDTVDTPGYINYGYAVQMVRSVVGFLVDHAQVVLPLRNGDFDGDGLVTLDDHAMFAQCLAGPGATPAAPSPFTSADCLGAFDFDADDDVDLNDARQFELVFGAGDCNGNGVADDADVASGASEDCNGNGSPDECDVAQGDSPDCNANGVPDECDLLPARLRMTGALAGVHGFVDISANGTPLNLLDDSEASVTMPFTNDVFTTTSVRVGNNGGIGFGGSELDYENAAIPSNDAFEGAQALLVLWDDLDSDSGNVYHRTIGFAPSRTFIVEWYNRPHYPGDTSLDGDEATFQIQVFEAPVNGIYAQFVYQDTDFLSAEFNHGASATIGYQHGAESDQWSIDQPNAVGNGVVLSLYRPRGEEDCNANAAPDSCDIAEGTSMDANQNGVPDECE